MLTATKGVYLGALLQRWSPLLLLGPCFGLVALAFTGLELRRLADFGAAVRRDWRDLAWLNAATAFAWVSYFYALKLIEPAVAGALSSAIGPLVTLALTMQGGQRVRERELTASLGVLLGVAVLIGATSWGVSGVGQVPGWRLALGLVAAIFSGIGAAGCTVSSKRLSLAGWSAERIMAGRFYLIVAAGFALFPPGQAARLAAPGAWGNILLVAGVGLTIPLYSLQLGIARCTSIVTSLVLATMPLFTYALQALDARLSLSLYSLAGIAITVVFSVAGVFGKPAPRVDPEASAG